MNAKDFTSLLFDIGKHWDCQLTLHAHSQPCGPWHDRTSVERELNIVGAVVALRRPGDIQGFSHYLVELGVHFFASAEVFTLTAWGS